MSGDMFPSNPISRGDHDPSDETVIDRLAREQITPGYLDHMEAELNKGIIGIKGSFATLDLSRVLLSYLLGNSIEENGREFLCSAMPIFELYSIYGDMENIRRRIVDTLSLFSSVFASEDTCRIDVRDDMGHAIDIYGKTYTPPDLHSALCAKNSLEHLNAVLEMSGGLSFLDDERKYIIRSGFSLLLDHDRLDQDIIEWRDTYYPIYVETVLSGVPAEDITA